MKLPEPRKKPELVEKLVGKLKTTRMTQEEFDALSDYSRSLPTGTTIGKRWKRRRYRHSVLVAWEMGEYVPSDREGMVGVQWTNIEIVEED